MYGTQYGTRAWTVFSAVLKMCWYVILHSIGHYKQDCRRGLLVQLSGAAKLFQFIDRSFTDKYYKSTKWTGKTVKLSTKGTADEVYKDSSPLAVWCEVTFPWGFSACSDLGTSYVDLVWILHSLANSNCLPFEYNLWVKAKNTEPERNQWSVIQNLTLKCASLA